MDDATRLRRIGERAAAEIEHGMLVGLGTGSTAAAMLEALAVRVNDGLQVTGVATSESTRATCARLGIPLLELDQVDHLDLCIDGADEIDPQLNVVKGRGGALLYEKLVALRAKRLIIIANAEKLVGQLGTRLPLPVEVVPFGYLHTGRLIESLGLKPVVRLNEDATPYLTDGGHYIFDCESDGIQNAAELAAQLKSITGVVDHGLFIGMTDLALTIDANGTISELYRT
jgi:ribose 5-phosphate isomerase A